MSNSGLQLHLSGANELNIDCSRYVKGTDDGCDTNWNK